MKSFVETVVGGAVGLIALYVVGRVAFEAGKGIAREECKYEELQRKNQELENRCVPTVTDEDVQAMAVRKPERKDRKRSGIMSIVGIMGGKNSMLRHLMQDPEDHRVEAYVDGDELHVNVRRRNA